MLWNEDYLTVRIIDDGPGFSTSVINRLGDPFVRRRRRSGRRPGYEGMGLGLFIAKTLLERSGAEVSFANGRDPYEASGGAGERTGAVVEARWRRDTFPDAREAMRTALGENRPIEV